MNQAEGASVVPRRQGPMQFAAAVHIVECDPRVVRLAVMEPSPRIVGHESREACLVAIDESPVIPQCVVSGLQHAGTDGLRLLQQFEVPVILVAPTAGVSTVARAMHMGALTVLPGIDDPELSEWIRRGLELDASRLDETRKLRQINERIESLTPKQWAVMSLMAEGLTQKQIAMRMDISVQTVSKHWTRVLDKMEADNVVTLVTKRLGRLRVDAGHGNPLPDASGPHVFGRTRRPFDLAASSHR